MYCCGVVVARMILNVLPWCGCGQNDTKCIAVVWLWSVILNVLLWCCIADHSLLFISLKAISLTTTVNNLVHHNSVTFQDVTVDFNRARF
jgi:hypothetical protein